MPARARDSLQRVLKQDLRHPLYLTPDEVEGGWWKLFPDPATPLPSPYPIYDRDEEEIVAYGFPVLISPTLRQIRTELEKLVRLETEFRMGSNEAGGGDKAKVMAQRERYMRSMSAVVENAMLNDYGRRLLEVLVLFHSGDLAQAVAAAPTLAMRRDLEWGRGHGDELRCLIAAVCADLLQRAAQSAADRLRRLARTTETPSVSPLLGVVCHDQLLLVETTIPSDLTHLKGYMKSVFRHDAGDLAVACRLAWDRLGSVLEQRRDLAAMLHQATGIQPSRRDVRVLLQPRVHDALRAAGLLGTLELTEDQVELLREIGLRLKRFELLSALRRRVLRVESQEGGPVLAGRSPPIPISISTRPFDFTRPGVVDSAVRRFGLVYDLSNFTAQIEEVRKKGRGEEERALQFMYVFQSQLEEIRRRRRLTFEKFLGDGAFYSARRALRVISAACEIQGAYDALRRNGFPFDRGLRIAMNFGTYRLLPMLTPTGQQRFEFFGHGIVELARLTTGKSTREVEEIAEFLVHSGFDPDQVDGFLGPLLSARGGREEGAKVRYAARIDSRGELVNEGMVFSVPFLVELEKELGHAPIFEVEIDGMRWAVLPLRPDSADSAFFGLRYLGVARLKGLAPVELVEARVCDKPPRRSPVVERNGPLVAELRRLAKEESEEADEPIEVIPEDLVVVTFFDDRGKRTWIFGEYRAGDDVLLHAIQIQIRTADLADDESIEMWLFRNRLELLRLYESLRREASGASMPLSALRRHDEYLGCFLAAPHRAPA